MDQAPSALEAEVLEELHFIDSSDLFNMLQVSNGPYSLLGDPNYLLLLDVRSRADYGESHILTAKMAQKGMDGSYLVPFGAEVECKDNVVVYDGNTTSMRDTDSTAIACARAMWEGGSRNKVNILKGGYEEFSAIYPFLRSQKVVFMPRELDDIQPYPFEIIQTLLYIGNWDQGNSQSMQRDLKIMAHVCVGMQDETLWPGTHEDKLRIEMDDGSESGMFEHFSKTCDFIDERIGQTVETKKPVIVFDQHGISVASTLVMAYLMHSTKMDLARVWQRLSKVMPNLRPNRGFVAELAAWEEQVLGKRATNVDDPKY